MLDHFVVKSPHVLAELQERSPFLLFLFYLLFNVGHFSDQTLQPAGGLLHFKNRVSLVNKLMLLFLELYLLLLVYFVFRSYWTFVLYVMVLLRVPFKLIIMPYLSRPLLLLLYFL